MLAASGDRLIYERVISGTRGVCATLYIHIVVRFSLFGKEPTFRSPTWQSHSRSDGAAIFEQSVAIHPRFRPYFMHLHAMYATSPPPPTVRMAGPRVYSLYNSVLFLQHITPRVIRLFCRPVHVERWPAKRVYRRRRTRFLLSTSFEAQNWRKDKCRCSNSSRYTSRRNTRTKVREIFSYLFHDLYKFSQFDLFSSLWEKLFNRVSIFHSCIYKER